MVTERQDPADVVVQVVAKVAAAAMAGRGRRAASVARSRMRSDWGKGEDPAEPVDRVGA